MGKFWNLHGQCSQFVDPRQIEWNILDFENVMCLYCTYSIVLYNNCCYKLVNPL